MKSRGLQLHPQRHNSLTNRSKTTIDTVTATIHYINLVNHLVLNSRAIRRLLTIRGQYVEALSFDNVLNSKISRELRRVKWQVVMPKPSSCAKLVKFGGSS